MVRLHYLDNLRWACILLLFPCHTAFIFGMAWYDYYLSADRSFVGAHVLMTAIMPWIMPLLFCIAGMTTSYALRKRTPREYLNERVKKLLVPFLAGIVFVCPVVAYYARNFPDGGVVSFPAAVVQFFGSLARFPDLNRMAGDFSVGHLWFIIFLFLISVFALGLILIGRWLARTPVSGDPGLWVILLLFVPVWLLNLTSVLVSMYSFPAYFALFLIGYCLLSREPVQARLEAHRTLLLSSWIVLTVGVTWISGIVLDHGELLWGLSPAFVLTGWIGVLALLGTGRHFLNLSTLLTVYLTAASYPVYILHQAVLVAVAYYILPLPEIPPALQFLAIVIASILLTFGVYEIIRRIPGVRALFGINGQEKGTS